MLSSGSIYRKYRMGNNVEMTNSEHQGIDLFNEEFLAKGGMSTA